MDKLREDEVLNSVIDSIKQYQDSGYIDDLIKSQAGVNQVLNDLIKHEHRQPDKPRVVNVYGSGSKVVETILINQ